MFSKNYHKYCNSAGEVEKMLEKENISLGHVEPDTSFSW
jgi:hypothetical protein